MPLDLFLHDRFVGVVEADSRNRNRIHLDIDRGYTNPEIVLSESFTVIPGYSPSSEAVSNFLGGYVPEGKHREQMAAQRRISKDDLFGLLHEFGESIAGAVSLRREPATRTKPRLEELTDKDLQSKFQQAIRESDQGIVEDSRSTLPGYQPKVLVAQAEGKWFLPRGGAHSTYILKPQVPTRPLRLFDEYYSHQLTRHMGLSQFESYIAQVGQTTYLAIERFDRIVEGEAVNLLHQEDLAQALGLDWRDTDTKFQDTAWPTDPKRATSSRIAEVLGSIPGQERMVEQWLRQLTFHVAIGNNDAHAKNVAIMHMATGAELSQVYDAVPNLFQDELIKWDMALAVDGVFDHRRISSETLVNEAISWGTIREPRAEQIVSETLAELALAFDVTALPEQLSPGLHEGIGWNLERLASGKEISQPKRSKSIM